MPLTRFNDDHRERDGDVVFRMTDGDKLVPCRVGREALADYTVSTGEPVIAMFEAHRDTVERAASIVYDAGGPCDHEGGVLVTLTALQRAEEP